VINIPAGNLINGVETFNITQVEANPAKTYVEFDKLVGGVWSKVTGQWFYDTNVFDFTVDTALYGDGKYQIKVSTWDKANNHTSATSARTVDNTGPTVTVKPESVAVTGGYESLSVKLADLNKVDKVTINGVLKDLSNNTYSDVNGIKPGVFGAVEGLNTLVAYDEAGNTTTFTFTLVVVPAVVAPPAGPADPASTGAASSGGGAGALDALPALNVNGDPDVLLPVAGGLLASGLLAFGASVAPKRRNRRTA